MSSSPFNGLFSSCRPAPRIGYRTWWSSTQWEFPVDSERLGKEEALGKGTEVL